MQASQILRNKGAEVTTVAPTATVAEAVALLREHNVGALVASSDGATVDGMLSERDVVRRLANDGAQTLQLRVSDIMATTITTCPPETRTDELMSLMTQGRFRHVPIVEDGRLIGIVSIGDVVKVRIDELALERETLEQYITQGG